MSDVILNDLWPRLRSLPFVENAGGGGVPLPSAAGEMSNHLFVNLTYAKDAPVLHGSELLNQLRELALKTMLLIRDCGAHEGFETVCVSIFNIPREGVNLRMYRTRMHSIRFGNFDKQNFLFSVSGEETHLPELRHLLAQAPGSRSVT